MMDQEPRWPNRWPYRRMLAIVLSFVAFGYFVKIWRRHAPAFEAFYLGQYARSYVATPNPKWHVIFYGRDVAVPSDPGPFVVRNVPIPRVAVHSWLRDNIYDGHQIWYVLLWPVLGFLGVLLVLLPIALWADNRTNAEARSGRLIRGPRVISHWRWNLRTVGKQRDFYVETE